VNNVFEKLLVVILSCVIGGAVGFTLYAVYKACTKPNYDVQSDVVFLCTLSTTTTLLFPVKKVWGDGNPNYYFIDKSGFQHRYTRSQFESCITLSPNDFKGRDI